MNFKQITNITRITFKKHSPEILTGIGVAGMIATAVMAASATPKALLLINEKEAEFGARKLTKTEVVKTTWKCYLPATVTGAMSIACIIGASSLNVRRNAALAAAYTVSETALKEYKSKVIETIGAKKEEEVRSKIDKAKLEAKPLSQNQIIITDKGDTLCFDSLSGRYFKSNIEKLKQVENELNRVMLLENSVTLNQFYYELGLCGTKVGEDLGWSVDKGFIELVFTSQIAEDGTPCIVIDYAVSPRYDYY